MKIKKHELLTMTEMLTTANGERMVIDGVMLLTLSLGDVQNNQMVYLTPKVDCIFLSQRTFKELHVLQQEFPDQVVGAPQVAETGQVAKCTATDDEDNNGRGCDFSS